MTQQREPDLRPSPGARFSLRDFTGEGRPVGVPPLVAQSGVLPVQAVPHAPQ